MSQNQSTRNEPRATEPGYRGSLPTREDRLARPWVVAVIGIFLLIFVLAFLGIPSRLFPEPTPVPLPSVPASTSVEPSASASASASDSASASASASASEEPSASASASASASVSPSPSGQ